MQRDDLAEGRGERLEGGLEGARLLGLFEDDVRGGGGRAMALQAEAGTSG